jgi:putative tryptophan/tyrosine transport system substrate-binding protein
MRRREFIAALGSAAAWPVVARTQQAGMPVVVFLDPYEPEESAPYRAAFRKGLSEMGFADGRNVAIERHATHREFRRAAELIAEFVRRGVAVFACASLNSALAAKTVTTTIPIVFMAAGDPVATGLVASLGRPGGNVTGISSLGSELGTKQLDLLHELVPHARRFAVLVDPRTTFANSTMTEMQAAVAAIGQHIETFTASTNREIDAGFASVVQKGTEALVVANSALFESSRTQLTTLATYHRLPAIYPTRAFILVGGLMSYGANWVDNYRQVGIYTGRVLKGEKPADLPVMQPTKFQFVINSQTARTLGIDVPPTLLAIADEVIE